MNKTALRNFAINARNELLEKVTLQARKLGITKHKIADASIETSDAVYIDGRLLTSLEGKQRNKVISRIEEIGFDQVMEETAYTWFNRFAALRFMEVNDYLPTRVRVLSSETEGSTEPDMIREALSLNLPIDKEYVYNLKVENDTENLFKYLIKLHCNDLNRYMPFMFETIEDYTEILFPEGLLSTDSFVKEMTDTDNIPEEDWQQVEIIGWLYQYYIAEEKDQVFADLKKNIKITQDTLPAATQLFTPNWIVRYMVENSLGRIWLESYPNSLLKQGWEYYLDEPNQDNHVKKRLEVIKHNNVNPEEITFLDPACGSGHILIYAFDVFYDMYIEQGYVSSEVPKLILEQNLYGLDVDNRAAQLASFAVMMKAREKSRRVFRQKIKLNITAIQESNWLTDDMITSITKDENNISSFRLIRDNFIDAKEYGSLLESHSLDYKTLSYEFEEYNRNQVDLVEWIDKQVVLEKLSSLLKQAEILSNNYDVVCTNPPYMGRRSMNANMKTYMDQNFKNAKSDLFAAFIEKSFELTKEIGFSSMVTMQSWMFLSSYEKFRKFIINKKTITTLLHMDNMVMGIAFGTAATVIRNNKTDNYKGRFTEIKYNDITEHNQPFIFPSNKNRNEIRSSKEFSNIPGYPIAYWISEQLTKIFSERHSISKYGKPCKGIDTGNNHRFLKFWHEINNKEIGINFNSYEEANESDYKYYPYNKGGPYRKWYGNNDYVIYWHDNGREIRKFEKSNLRNKDYYRKDGLTWSTVTSSSFSLREFSYGFYFDNGGCCLFIDNKRYFLGLLNSKVFNSIQKISPTLNFQPGDIGRVPVIINNAKVNLVDVLVSENISISKADWDSFETSWDFTKHPLLKFLSHTIDSSYIEWAKFAESQFNELKENEEELNQIFIEIYGLQDELTPDVADKDVTINKADLERDIKSFISYAVGCTFGRYSLDEEGLIYAGGEFDQERYKTFPADKNNILPILPGAYFEDDIVTRFISFVETTYGKDELEENLDFVADAIGKRKNETSREALRRYFLNNFYKDHVQTYKKRPIYWLFTSGKEKAFNCLIYMHRYDKTTLSRIRTDYLHEVQVRYETERKDLLAVIEGDASAKEIRDAKKQLTSVEKKIDELKAYDEKLHHLADQQIDIDLDDGVKVNYEKFKGLVGKI